MESRDSAELFNLEELSEAFGLDRVSKGGAKFDPEKTKWFQQQYIRSASNEKLAELLADKFPSELTTEQKVSICSLMKERATFAEDIVKDGAYFYQKPTSYDEKVLSKKWKENTASLIEQWMDILKEIESFTSANIEADFKAFLEKNQLGFGAVLLPFRILVTGVGAGPGMFDISEFLGKEEVLERIEKGLVQIEHIKNEA